MLPSKHDAVYVEYRNGHSRAEGFRQLTSYYGSGFISYSYVVNLYSQFNRGDFSILTGWHQSTPDNNQLPEQSDTQISDQCMLPIECELEFLPNTNLPDNSMSYASVIEMNQDTIQGRQPFSDLSNVSNSQFDKVTKPPSAPQPIFQCEGVASKIASTLDRKQKRTI